MTLPPFIVLHSMLPEVSTSETTAVHPTSAMHTTIETKTVNPTAATPQCSSATVTIMVTPSSCSDQQQSRSSSSSSDSDDVVTICVPVVVVVGIIIVTVLVIVGGVVWSKTNRKSGSPKCDTTVYKHSGTTAIVENDLYGLVFTAHI